MMRLIFWVFLALAPAITADAKTCQRLEGVNMECSPDIRKPCQNPVCETCAYCKDPSTFNLPIISGGNCTAYETQCSGSGENQTCSQVCTAHSPTTCTLNPVPCSQSVIYKTAEMIAPGCPPRCKECPEPPEGYQKCPGKACEPDGQCPPT